LVSTIERQWSGVSSRNPRVAPKAGVGEDGVEAAEAVGGGRGQRFDLVPFGHVARGVHRPLGPPELVGQPLQRFLAAGAEDEAVARLGRAAGGLGADAAGGARDQQYRLVHVAIVSRGPGLASAGAAVLR
jgi:hypothetical protein